MSRIRLKTTTSTITHGELFHVKMKQLHPSCCNGTNSVSFHHHCYRYHCRRSLRRRVRMIPIIVCWCSLAVVFLITSATTTSTTANNNNNNNNNYNPYTILGISPSSTAKDIKKKYYQLCLKYHPDKLQHLPKRHQQQYEETFKEIQWAYTEVSSGNGKQQYHRQSPFNFPTTNGNPLNDYYRSVFEQYRRQTPSMPGSRRYYHHNHRGPFGGSRGISPNFFPTFVNTNHSNNNKNGPKFLFRQHVSIPLSDLYTGQSHYQFSLASSSSNIMARFMAAFRGGMGPYLLGQSMLYAIPLLRFSKLFSFAIFLYMLYYQLPILHDDDIHDYLVADLLPGYKGGTTKLIFTSDILQIPNMEVQIILEEERHAIYHRMNNDLHVHCTISRRQAINGCSIQVSSIRSKNISIKVVRRRRQQQQQRITENESFLPIISIYVPPDTQSGDTIHIVGQGWPIRKKQTRRSNGQPTMTMYGDLVATIHVEPLSSTLGSSNNNGRWFNSFRRRGGGYRHEYRM